MKPQARIQTGIDVLEQIQKLSLPMDSVVGDYMRSRRYIGSKDRAAVVERVYEIVRFHARLGWWLDKIEVRDTPRNRIIAHLLLTQGADEKRLKDLFDGSKYAPEALTAAEEHMAQVLTGKSLNHPDMPDAVRCECPPDYEDKLRAYFGDDFAVEMEAMIPAAHLDLRTNIFLVTREQAMDSLRKNDIETEETPYSPWGLRCQEKIYLAKTKAFVKGLVEIQDEGSQLIAHQCGAQPGMQVLDYCAGGGGKTLALAAAMQRKGRIVAMDTDEKRLNKGRDRYKKAGVADIIEVRPLSENRHKKWLRRQENKFDVVLCDVPCSGTGTWRRNPDMRWNNYGPALAELLEIQAEILEKVAHCVKPGGRLVYATCSLLPEENEKQIEALLKTHPEFSVKPVDPALGDGFMRLTPHRHETDGFFAAVLVRD